VKIRTEEEETRDKISMQKQYISKQGVSERGFTSKQRKKRLYMDEKSTETGEVN